MTPEKVLQIAEYLTPMELEIIRLVAEGRKAKKIAKALRMDKRAVERRINIIESKIREVAYSV